LAVDRTLAVQRYISIRSPGEAIIREEKIAVDVREGSSWIVTTTWEEIGLGGGKRIREALGHYSDSQMSPPTTPFFFVQNAIGLQRSQQSRVHQVLSRHRSRGPQGV